MLLSVTIARLPVLALSVRLLVAVVGSVGLLTLVTPAMAQLPGTGFSAPEPTESASDSSKRAADSNAASASRPPRSKKPNVPTIEPIPGTWKPQANPKLIPGTWDGKTKLRPVGQTRPVDEFDADPPQSRSESPTKRARPSADSAPPSRESTNRFRRVNATDDDLPANSRDDEEDVPPGMSRPGGNPPKMIDEPEVNPRTPTIDAAELPDGDRILGLVQIEGNTTIPASEIKRYIKCRPGRSVTQKLIKDDVEALSRTRWFVEVTPVLRRGEDGWELTYRVLERPVVRSVQYVGAKKIKKEKLAAITNLKQGSPYDVSANRECARRLEEHYHEKGYAFATVELIKGNSRQEREVIFQINEGPKVKVTKIKFEGNKFFNDELLKLKTRTKPVVLGVFGGKYDPSTIPDDEKAVQDYYHSLGFFDVEITHRQAFSQDNSKVTLEYTVDEGERYRIRSIEITGNEIFTEEELRSEMKIQPGEFFNAQKLSVDVEKIRDKYGKLGRLFAKTDAVPRFLEEPGEIDLVYRIDEANVVRVREIRVHIEGDYPHTRTNLPIKIMPIHPGDLADPAKIKLAKSRLAGSQYFGTGGQGGGEGPRLDITPVKDHDWIRGEELNFARGQNYFRDPDSDLYSPTVAAAMRAQKRTQTRGTLIDDEEDDDGDHETPSPNNVAPQASRTTTRPVRSITNTQPSNPTPSREPQARRPANPSIQFQAGHSAALPSESQGTGSNPGNPRPEADPISGRPKPRPGAEPLRIETAKPPTTGVSNDREPLNRQSRAMPSTEEMQPVGASIVPDWSRFDEQYEFAKLAVSSPRRTPKHDYDDIAPLVIPLADSKAVVRGQNTSDTVRGQSADDTVRGQTRDPATFGEADVLQGDPFGRAAREQNQQLLPQNDLPPPDFVDIDAYLTEARTGRLMFGVGVNSNSGLVGNIVLSESNFDILRPPTSWSDIVNGTAWRGAGQRFRIEAMPGVQVSRYLVDWSDPYFLDTDYNLGLSGFYFQRFYRNWSEERLGGKVRVGRQLTQRLSAGFALRLEDVNIYNPSFPRPADLQNVLGWSTLSTARFSLIHDTRDGAFIPSAGHYIEGGVEQAFGKYNFSRFDLEGRQYFTTYRRADGGGKHIVNLLGQFGYTTNGTPIFERYYAGGYQSFRGFAFRGVGPVDTPTGVALGGQYQLLGTVEYTLPVMANEMVKVVGFCDAGTVDSKISMSNVRVAVGGGLRLTIPAMGPAPIALDWAIPIKKEDSDTTQYFSFYIGATR